jgi:hypothetical protein
MRFDEWRYLWPPRPGSENAIAKSLLPHFEEQGWIAQTKMNGTCNVMGVAPDRKTIRAMSRHNDEHKLWSPSVHTTAPFKKLPGVGWYVFVAELMHSKVTGGPRDTNYIHDILVADGEYLVGVTFAERQALLHKVLGITPATKKTKTHYILDDHTWVAVNHTTGFPALFETLVKTVEHEGVVVKNPNAKLGMCSREKSNSAWQVKCRRGGKNYTS